MDIKLGGLGAKIQGLNRISAQPVSAVFAWKLTKVLRKLGEEAKDFEDVRITLCRKHGKKDFKGEPLIIEKDGRQQYVGLEENEEFITELNELADKTVSIDFVPIPVGQMELEGIKLSIDDMLMLGDFVTGD